MIEGDQKQKQFDREVRDMVSAITHRISNLQKAGTTSHHLDHEEEMGEDDDNGVRIITLAGSNTGATMRSELEDEDDDNDDEKIANKHKGYKEDDPLSTYVNSNFQAINNSIMMGGSYTSNDPGIHVDLSHLLEQQHRHLKHKADKDKHVSTKGKKKDHDKEAFKSDHHSDSSAH